MVFDPQDPDKLFMISAISRETICEGLNSYLEACELEERLAPHDYRLSDEFCQIYADFLGTLEDPAYRGSDNAKNDAIQQMQYEALQSIGAIAATPDILKN